MQAGDLIELRKAHPCGGTKWEVVRTGADWKIRCLGCGRCVVLSPDELRRRMKTACSAEGHEKK